MPGSAITRCGSWRATDSPCSARGRPLTTATPNSPTSSSGATKERAWRDFLADDEWKEIKRVTAAAHGDLVGRIEDRVLAETEYSPGRS
jgi:hypothetical protein